MAVLAGRARQQNLGRRRCCLANPLQAQQGCPRCLLVHPTGRGTRRMDQPPACEEAFAGAERGIRVQAVWGRWNGLALHLPHQKPVHPNWTFPPLRQSPVIGISMADRRAMPTGWPIHRAGQCHARLPMKRPRARLLYGWRHSVCAWPCAGACPPYGWNSQWRAPYPWTSCGNKPDEGKAVHLP